MLVYDGMTLIKEIHFLSRKALAQTATARDEKLCERVACRVKLFAFRFLIFPQGSRLSERGGCRGGRREIVPF